MVKTTNKTTISFIVGFLILIGIVAVTKPPGLFDAIIPLLIMLSISLLVYAVAPFKNQIIGLNLGKIFDGRGLFGIFAINSFTRSLFLGLTFGGGFFLIAKFFPGASIGLPIIPNALSDNLRFSLIVLAYPIVEEIFFRGVILGYLRNTKIGKRSILFAVVVSSILFALAHVGAYITGIYNYPSFTEGFDSFKANISSFLAAFTMGSIAAFYILKTNVRNLVFTMIFHIILNLIIFTSLTVIFLS